MQSCSNSKQIKKIRLFLVSNKYLMELDNTIACNNHVSTI